MYEKKIVIEVGDLAGLNLSEEDSQYLLRNGLPLINEVNPPLGVVFHKPFIAEKSGKKCCVFGREVWDVDLYLCIDSVDGRIFANAPREGGRRVYINANLREFFDFYNQVSPLWVKCDSSGKDYSFSDSMTPEELFESIAQRRKKRLENPSDSSDDSSDSELNDNIKRVKASIKNINKRAVWGDSWWGRIIDDMER
jgi:hypothetical protein